MNQQALQPGFAGTPRQRSWLQLMLLVLVYSLILYRVFNIPLYDAGSARDSIHGDSYSDQNTHSAVMYFYDKGFTESAFLPMHNYHSDSLENPRTGPYTHYPAFSDVALGLWARTIGSTQPSHLRLLPVLFSLLWFLLIFQLFAAMLPNQRAAFIGAAALVLSNYFIAWADSLHRPMWDELFKFAGVWLLYDYYTDERRCGWKLAGIALVLFLAVNTAYDPALYLAVTVAGFAWVFDRKLFTKETLLLAAATLGGFFLHLWQVKLFYGSWELAIEDLGGAAVYRTTGEATNEVYRNQTAGELGREITWVDYLKLPFDWLNRIERFFLFPGWGFVPLALLGLRQLRKEHRQNFRLALVLLIGSFIWTLVFAQQTIVHIFNTRHLGLFYGLVIGYGLLSYRTYVLAHFRQQKWPWMLLHVVFIGYLLAIALSQQVWDLFVKNGFAWQG